MVGLTPVPPLPCFPTQQGYNVTDMPDTAEGIMNDVLHDKEARLSSPELNVEYRMSVDEYMRLTPYASELEENWGKAPGKLNTDGKDMLIYGKR